MLNFSFLIIFFLYFTLIKIYNYSKNNFYKYLDLNYLNFKFLYTDNKVLYNIMQSITIYKLQIR